jgi:outer membrane protein OmpA-like peptidoglycan-associated protein
MRMFTLTLLAGGLMAGPAALYAQQAQGPQSADDYVCQLSGNCDNQQAGDDADAATPSGRPRISATRGFALARPSGSAQSNTAARPSQRRPSRVATRRPDATRPVGRVDLRVQFALGSATLSPEQRQRMQVFAEALRRPQLSNMRFRIEGHTDSTGSRASNMVLSRERAEAVADFLKSQGVPASRLDVRGYGYDRPLAGHRASDPVNRRVEAVRIS